MSINLSSVERESGQLSTKAAAALAENLKLVQELSRQIRTISYLLHPPLLDEIGLACALEWYVKGFAGRSNIQVSLDLLHLLTEMRSTSWVPSPTFPKTPSS